MKKAILNCITISALLCLCGCQLSQDPSLDSLWSQLHTYQNQENQNLWYDSSVYKSFWYSRLNKIVKIAPDRFVFKEKDRNLKIPIYFSNPLTEYNTETKYMIVLIHGGGLNASHSFIGSTG